MGAAARLRVLDRFTWDGLRTPLPAAFREIIT